MGADGVAVHWGARKCPACRGRMETYHFNWLTNALGITRKKFKCKVCGYEEIPGEMRKEFEARQRKKPKKGHKHKKHRKKKRK